MMKQNKDSIFSKETLEIKAGTRIFSNDQAFPLRAMLQDPQEDTPPHRHDFTECVLVIRGTGKHQCGNHPRCTITTGDIIIIPQGGYHSYRECNNLAVINLLFNTEKLPPVLMELYTHPTYKRLFLHSADSYGEADFPLFHLKRAFYEEIRFYASRFATACNQPGNHCYKLGLFMVLLNQICNADVHKDETKESLPLNIPKIISFLGENYQRKVYTEELCKLSGMSPATLIRHFHAALGATPAEYLRTIRLRKAAEMLLNTQFSLKEIAIRCGFQSNVYFFRMFKKEYKIPPLQYRRKIDLQIMGTHKGPASARTL